MTSSSDNNEKIAVRGEGESLDVSDGDKTWAKDLGADEEVLVRKRRRSHHKKDARRKRVLIVVAVLVALVVVVVGGAFAFVQMGKMSVEQNNKFGTVGTGNTAVSYDEGKTVKYNGHTYLLNENMVSLCFMGYDLTERAANAGKNGQADSVMVLAMNLDTGRVTAIAIPRDSMVDVGEYVGSTFLGQERMQLCLAFSYGTDADTGAQYTSRIASRILYNVPINYYFALNMEGVAAVNDAIGGVALTAIETIPNTGIYEGDDVVLYGTKALSYVRYRNTAYLDSSLARQARQKQYIDAFATQAIDLAKESIPDVVNLFETAMSYSATNVGAQEVTYLATELVGKNPTFDITSIEGSMEQGEVYAEYVLDKTSAYETVLNVYYTRID